MRSTTGSALIVGAGPVGLTLALALDRRGVPVRIIDSAATRTDTSKALVLWPRTLEMLDIEGCADRFVNSGIRGTGARLQSDRGELAHMTFGGLDSPFPFPVLIPQSETERILGEVLEERGVVVERETTLQEFSSHDDGVHLVITGPDGTEEALTTPWLLACDGAHSTVRRGLGVEFSGTTLDMDFVLADVHLDGGLPDGELSIVLAPEGVVALFPIIGGRFRVVAEIHERPATDDGLTLDAVQGLLDRRVPIRLRAHDLVWASNFRINERKVDTYRYGRVFLAGDAAHVHSPAGGQGMNTGMQDAFNLAWRLSMVAREVAHDELLDGYSVERSAVADMVLRNAGAMTRMTGIRNGMLQRLRNAVIRVVGRRAAFRRRMVEQLSELDVAYRKSPLTTRTPDQAPGVAPGDRVRDLDIVVYEGSATTLHEALRDGRFLLLSVECDALEVPPHLRTLAHAATAAGAPRLPPGFVYLVRPDAYLAMSTRPDRVECLLTTLSSLSTGQSATTAA